MNIGDVFNGKQKTNESQWFDGNDQWTGSGSNAWNDGHDQWAKESTEVIPALTGVEETKPVDMKRWMRNFERREAKNFHSENVVAMAKLVGTPEEIAMATKILKDHERQGHLTDELKFNRDVLSKKLWPLVQQKLNGEQGVAEATGDDKFDNMMNNVKQPGAIEQTIKQLSQQKEQAEMQLAKVREATRAIKYEDTVRSIVAQVTQIAQSNKHFDQRELKWWENGISEIQGQLESKVYEIEDAFKDVVRDLDYKIEELQNDLDYPDELEENAETLNIGDPIVVTGDVQFKGATGEVADFGQDKRFVVVNLYNHGKHSFHSSDVSYNSYADSDEEEADMYDRDPEFRDWASSNEVDEARYPSSYWSHDAAMRQQGAEDKRRHNFKRQELEHELRGEEEAERREKDTTYYILVNGKILKKDGVPFQFRGKAAANGAALKMMDKDFNKGKSFHLTTKCEDNPALAQGSAPASAPETKKQPVFTFFDAGRGGKSFTDAQLSQLGLRQAKNGKWFVPTDNPETVGKIEQTLNVKGKTWSPPVKEDSNDFMAADSTSPVGGKVDEDQPTLRDSIYNRLKDWIIEKDPEFITRHGGPQAVMNAMEEVADWYGDAEEFGSSDFTACLQSLFRQFGEKFDRTKYYTNESYYDKLKESRDAKAHKKAYSMLDELKNTLDK